ncbi:MAG: ABC transporter ATP-binding protein [Gammaproteobacteria bacterium]|nr:ABC transporter ATP-binding protein [Gammaproteobacteria bacterium]
MADTALIEARDVSRILPGPVPVTLVRDINLTVRRGEFIAIVGPSGSGKSSLLYLLGLLDAPTHGTIYLEGANTTELNREQQAQMRLTRLGFVFQFHFLLHEFTTLGNVMIPLRKLGGQNEIKIEQRARALLAELDMEEFADRLPEQLSGGQRQRVAVARALANNPAIILADEPTGNLDSKNAQQVFDIFKRLAERNGQTVIVVTHGAHLAQQTHRRIRLIDGRIAEDS